MKPTTRDRLALPVLLPIGILLVIGLALWGFSRILLDVHGVGATTVALVVAGGIVVVAAVAAARPQVRGSTIAAMAGATAGIAMLAGGIALAVIVGGEEEGEVPGPGAGAFVALAAQDIAFDPTTLAAPAGQPFTIEFDNRDAGIQHNVQIFDNPEHSGTALLDGELITGPATVEYPVEPLAEGTYYFLCVVHPNMTGEIDAAEGGGGEGGGGGGGPGAVAVSALNVAFDTDSIPLPADAPSTIAFDNQDAGVQHNISIYANPELAEMLFQGELITGPDSIDYAVPPLAAGEYYFQCDVHPNMNGAVVVDPGGGGPEPTGGG